MNDEQTLVKFCYELSYEDLDDALVEHAKLVVLDSIGVIAAGFNLNSLYKKWAKTFRKEAGGRSTIIGVGLRTAAEYAALKNGTSGSSLELDEGNRFCAGHPAMHVIPAALAISEAQSNNGKELITAFIAGYEVAARIGRGVAPLKAYLHPHGTWGVIGSALSTAKLKKLTLQQMYQAIAIASNYSLNTLFDTALEGATVRDTYCGVANYLGIFSAELAQNGFTGLNDAIFRHFNSHGQKGFQASSLTDSIGERFEISRNYFKLHAACRYTHGAIDALNQIIDSYGKIAPNEIDKLEVHTYNLAAGLNNQEPINALQAKFSIPYAIAARLIYGHSSIDAFTTDAITEEVVKLSKKVIVVEKNEFSSLLPEKRPTQVTIFFKSGQKQSCLVEIPEGEGAKPYDAQQLTEKFQSLIFPIVGDQRGKEALKRLLDLENLKNVCELTKFFI